MRFTVDPWDPGYGASVETELTESTSVPTTDIEYADEDWRPLSPAARVLPADETLFVDGVRRIEARAWIEGGIEPVPGVFASWAAGVVRCDREAAHIVAVEVGRGVFAPTTGLDDIPTSIGRFVATPTINARPETLNTKINTCMTEVEARVAERTRRSCAELIVLDGPLRESTKELRDAVGVVKSHDVKYLPTALDAVVSDLAPGQRTPVFALDARFRKFSWYLRLPGPAGGPWAGIVRCEASAALPADEVIGLADKVAATLPRFASEPHKDPRAPQNLYPIGGLERDLRHRLGDAAVIYRALRRASAVLAPATS
ncbi:MAG TPA: hypothetical protein VGP92_03070 [Acidimicrobiia bacterium]|nr:hypothetical protein [Acidimicrobiia bacterium]